MKLFILLLYICLLFNITKEQSLNSVLNKLDKRHLYFWHPKGNDKQTHYTNYEKCMLLMTQDLKLAVDNMKFHASQETLKACDLFKREQQIETMKMKNKNLETLLKEKENEIYRRKLAGRVASSVLKDFYVMRY